VSEVNLGGGLGVAYESGDEPPGIGEYACAVRRAFEEAGRDAGLAATPALFVEPGRSIVAAAALTLYRVGTIKHIRLSASTAGGPGVRTYVAVDGGMSDNPRPATYGARYEAFVPSRTSAPRPLVATVAGKHCESGDVIVRDARVPGDLAVGDLLCTPATGAYGYAMASNYNKVPRPAVVFVSGGQAREVVRRESLDDLLRLEST
jgi:diaminopimelate decarboxylase